MTIMKFLDSIGMIGVFAFFALLLIGLIFVLRSLLKNHSEKLMKETREHDTLTKKFSSVDLGKYSSLMTNLGLALSLGMILTAFEFPSFDEQGIIDITCTLRVRRSVGNPYYRDAPSSAQNTTA